MRAVLIFNPTSGISTITEKRMSPEETERAILEGLRVCGIEPQVLYTTIEDGGREMARHAAQDGAELVIAAGGDGTIHAAANGLVGTQSILGIIPTGTMNNVARSLNIPDTIPAACFAIANGETRAIDMGKINDHTFLEVAGVGLEAELAPSGEQIKHPELFSIVRGIVSGLKTFFGFKAANMRIAANGGKHHSYHALQVTICNTPFYGLHLQMAPDILMDDGLLDVVIYRNISKFGYLRYALSLLLGRRLDHTKIKYLRVRSLHVTADARMEIHVDGDPGGYTPAQVTVLPAALRIRVAGKDAPGLQEDASTDTHNTRTSIPAQST
ncbi:MAG TPA: diacylglycerol kinase family protein [Ktedonobacteraceae bacterium]|nr:diacylglycerol kinase family protein [Ktedonobacteraceae bacterium]